MGLEHLILQLLKSPGGRLFVGLLLTVFGVLIAALAYPQIDSIRALRTHSLRIAADVIDSRVSSDLHGIRKSYDIRYQFRLVPHGPWYERSEKGPLARKELWATLRKRKWDEVTRSGKIDVDYLPSDPSVNEVAGEAQSELSGVYGLMGFSAVLAGLGLFLVMNGSRRLLSRNSARHQRAEAV